ncbi:hypothetical protein F8S13_08915 [Chloroflexia bacterium SDU3-3]|nr:hypothetical protein F8S13_08915 [Chloroflexia bacterium SDU3-3]
MPDNERQQEMIERLQEDERLRGDLGDEAAAALLAWAEAQVRALTDDPARPDAEVEPAVLQVRSAARRAAKSGADDPQAIAAQADAELASLRGAAQAPSPAPEPQPIEAVLAPAQPTTLAPAQPEQPAPEPQPTEATLAPAQPEQPTPEPQPTKATLAPAQPEQPTPEPQPTQATLAPAQPEQPAAPANATTPAPAESDALQQWRERLRRWLGR